MSLHNRRMADHVQSLLPAIQHIPQLIKSRQYNRADELLRDVSAALPAEDGAPVASFVLALQHICRACDVLSKTATQHRWALEETERQENDLRALVYALCRTLVEEDLADLKEPLNVRTLLAEVLPSTEANGDPLLRLWRRVQNLLTGDDGTESSSPQTLEVLPVSRHSEAGTADDHYQDQTSLPAGLPLAEPDTVSAAILDPATSDGQKHDHALVVYGLGTFQVYQNGQFLVNWSNRKGRQLLKYMILHRAKPVDKEILMELFWPDVKPEAARNNLNVTIYNLRQALQRPNDTFSYILFLDNCYLFNPDLRVWVDFEAFLGHFRDGRRCEKSNDPAGAATCFRAAERLYQGELYAEDRYDDWIMPQRLVMQEHYLEMVDWLVRYYLEQRNFDTCIELCRRQLAVDVCYEDAHRHLMLCYTEQGQYYLAMRQYQLCAEQLREQLDMAPGPETTKLYMRIRAGLDNKE